MVAPRLQAALLEPAMRYQVSGTSRRADRRYGADSGLKSFQKPRIVVGVSDSQNHAFSGYLPDRAPEL